MKKLSLHCGGFALLAACLLPLLSFGQEANNALITGRVSNAATEASLEGAVVAAQGTPYSTTTGRDGTYRLYVPAGTYSLAISYTGLDEQTVRTSVEKGMTDRHDVALTAGIYQLEKITVPGEREGNALAITIQRQAPNLKEVVSSDAFGNLAGNPAELLGRLPGIVADAGIEGRYVSVRGIDQTLTGVTMDGNRMANGASAGNTREFQFELMGVDRIERIEVVKAPTPDMDADTIGGVVNFVSKSAFDGSGARRIRFSAGGIWRPFYTAGGTHLDRIRPNWTVGYSEVFKGKLGVSFNYGFRQSVLALDVTTQSFEATTSDPAYMYQFSYNDFKIKRTRQGGGVKLDYKLSDHTRFYLNAQINWHLEYEDDNNSTYATSKTVATRDANGNLTGSGTIVPGYTTDRTEWRPLSGTSVQVSSIANRKGGRLENYAIGAVHEYETLSLDYDAYQSIGITDYPGNSTFQYTVKSVGLAFDRANRDRYFPTVAQTAGPDITNIGNYKDNVLNIDPKRGDDEYTGLGLNIKKKFATAAPLWLKAGFRLRKQTRELTRPRTRWNYVGPDGLLNSGDENLAQFLNPNIKSNSPVALPFPARPFRSSKGSSYEYAGFNIGTVFLESPGLFVEDVAFRVSQALLNRQSFSEKVDAGYVMGNIDLGKLGILAGVRVEKTSTWGEGALQGITPEEAALRAAWVGPVTTTELIRRTTAEYSRRISASGDYRSVFPGIHFKYEPIPGLVARASYSTSIGRPSIGNLIPSTTVNYENQTISTSNPSLKPQYADNFDAGIEYYFEPAGRVSAAVFYKDITDYQFSQGGIIVGTGPDNGFGGDYAGYSLTTRLNGGSAKIKGLELSYQQQFTFLPGWLQGFGAFANYTRLQTSGDYGGSRTVSTNTLTDFVPEAANVGVSYIRSPLSIRVQVKHRGKFLDTYNDNAALLIWGLPQTTVDIKTEYILNKRYSVYLDAYNIFNADNRLFEWGNGKPQNVRKDSVMILFGINGRL